VQRRVSVLDTRRCPPFALRYLIAVDPLRRWRRLNPKTKGAPVSVVEAVSEEVSVGLALRQFRDAVHGFADETVTWDGSAARRIPALYLRVRSAMSRQSSRGGTGVHQSRLPCGRDPVSPANDPRGECQPGRVASPVGWTVRIAYCQL